MPPQAIYAPTTEATPLTDASTGPAEPSLKLLVYVERLLHAVGALQRAVSDEDMPALLRAQRELLSELDRAALVLAVDRSPLADRLMALLPELQRGAEGDRQRLSRAEAELWRLLAAQGPPAPEKLPTPGPMARSLRDKIVVFQRALDSRDAAALLRAQSDLLAEIERVERAMGNERDLASIRLRASIADLRAALDENPTRLEAALRRMEQVAEAQPEQTRGREGGALERPPLISEARSASLRLRRAAKDVLERLNQFANAESYDSGQSRRRLVEAVDAAETALGHSSVQEAAALREALVLVREMLRGDSAAFLPARVALEDVILRDLHRWARLLRDHLAQLEAASAGSDPSDVARARRRLQDAVEATRNATYYDLSPAADTLRHALVPLSEVARGYDERVDDARAALKKLEIEG